MRRRPGTPLVSLKKLDPRFRGDDRCVVGVKTVIFPTERFAGAGMGAVLQGQRLFTARLVIGLTQGLALYLLYSAYDAKTWPGTNGLVFEPLVLVFLFIPTLLISALGEMPWRKAAAWAGIALAVVAGLAFFDNWSAWPVDWNFIKSGAEPHVAPSPQFFLLGAVGLFVAHAL